MIFFWYIMYLSVVALLGTANKCRRTLKENKHKITNKEIPPGLDIFMYIVHRYDIYRIPYV